MMSQFHIGLILSAALWSMAVAAKDVDLVLTSEEAPPHIMRVNGEVVGVAADRVVEMMHRAKLSYTLEMLPWARAYHMALQRPRTCVFSTTRTAEREASFKWIGPLDANDWIFYGLAQDNLHLNTLEDARKLRIGTYNDDVRDIYLREHGFQVDTAMDDMANARKLLARRIDVWASSPFKAQPVLMQNGWVGQIVPLLTFNHVDLYLACNPSVSDDLVDRLNGILGEMTVDGTTAAIAQRYEHWPQ